MALDAVSISVAAIAGMQAFFATCSFPLIPAFVGQEPLEQRAGWRGLSRTFGHGLIAGFAVLLVFTGLALVVAAVGKFVYGLIPYAEIAGGLFLIFFGLAEALGAGFSLRLPFVPLAKNGGASYYFGFGLAYALGSLGCSLPLFLLVMAPALTRGPLSAAFTFGVYGGVMLLLMVASFIILATSKKAIFRLIASSLPRIRRIGGALIALSGTYMTALAFRLLV